MSTESMMPAGAAKLAAARLLLARLGIAPADLLPAAAARPPAPPAPTFAEYMPVVSAAVGAGTRRVYGSYWNRIAECWGERRLDEPTPSDIHLLVEQVHLWHRIDRHLPWVAAQQISTHWLRHTTLTWVERSFGYAVARAYAGHTDGGSDPSPTTTYIRASVHEVAAALAALTGEPHPLA
jgi:hypothetical protein